MAGEQEVAPDAPCPGDHSVFRGRVLRGYKGGFFSNLLKGTDRPRPGSLPKPTSPPITPVTFYAGGWRGPREVRAPPFFAGGDEPRPYPNRSAMLSEGWALRPS